MSLHGSADHPQISLAYLPPTPRQTWSALAGAAVLLLGLAVLLPYAATLLPLVDGFITALDAIIAVTDLITAGLLLAHFSITGSRALWALACGYLFSALIVVTHGLTFPGVITPTGNLGGSPHTNFRIYLLWHLGLPVAIFAYVWLRDKGRTHTKAGVPTRTEIVATCGGVAVVALLSCFAWLALLPPVDPVAGRRLTATIMLICAAALCVLWVFRRSALDQWLMVVVLAMIVELAITALIGGRGRGTLGFYTGRLFSLVTSTVVLTGLLAETTKLYAGVARANMLTSIVSASQALSSEILLPNLVERLMKIALAHAGADRGLLILPSGNEYLTQAEAQANGDRIEITMRQAPMNGTSCPEALVRHVIRTRESVILDDACQLSSCSGDTFLHGRKSKSIFCLPLIKQRDLAGILVLENTLTAHAFTPTRIAVLELLAAQAAISLENTRLYSDLQEREAKVRRLVDANIIGICIFNLDRRILEANDAFLSIVGYSSDDVISGGLSFAGLTPPEWAEADKRHLAELAATGAWRTSEKEFFRKDGSRAPVLVGGAAFGERRHQGVAFVVDLTERKSAEEELRRKETALREAQAELAHVTRVTTMGELSASIAHEINQPIAGVVVNGNACLRRLARVTEDSVEIQEARETIQRIIRDGNRAGEIIGRIRALFKKTELAKEPLDLNETIREIIVLAKSEMNKQGVRLRLELSSDLPSVLGDRVQLQQVLLNLILNAIEAMAPVQDGARDLVIRTQNDGAEEVIVTVRDTGIGLSPASIGQVFKAFHTTKPGGLGMGLSISRSIVENHSGRLWATANDGPGVSFHFTVPTVSPVAAH